MTKKFLLGLALVLLSLNFVAAQEKTLFEEPSLAVKTQDANSFNAKNVQLNNIIVRNKGLLEERFLLSFQIPNFLENVLPTTGITLTAYNENGSLFGKQIWHSTSKKSVDTVSKNRLRIVLNTNPNLKGASSFSLSTFEDEYQPESILAECTAAANDSCGRGKVAGVNSGADGSCSFTCKN